MLLSFFDVLAKSGSFGFAQALASSVEAKPNVRLAKIELKKMCGGENEKYRRVGNECRLTRCPFVISFLCRWLPVKMVCFFCLIVGLLIVVVSCNMLAPNFQLYKNPLHKHK